MTTDEAALGMLAATIAAIVSMQWFLLREVRAAMNGLAREIRDLNLAHAIDLATRASSNAETRRIARKMVRERDPVRVIEIEQAGQRSSEDR